MLEPLSDEARREVLRRARRRRFKRNDVVFHDGDPGDTLHLVSKGHFAVRITTPLGDTAMVRVMGSDDHFGELAVLAPGPRTGSIVALDAAETLSIHRDEIRDLMVAVPKIEAVLTGALIAEIRRLSALLVEALYVPADQRIWHRLVELVGMYSEGIEPVVVPLTQDDLAQLAGTTRPTVNRVLRAAQDKGIVRLGRSRIEILDQEQVEHLAR